MKRFTWIIMVGLLVLSLSACSGGTQKVQVATDATWPPFEIMNEQTKQPEGFDIDLLNAVAEKAGIEIEYVNVPFDPLLTGLSTCQYDAAISSITITDERKKEMLFSDPYFSAGQVIAVGVDNTDITGKETLPGKIVGVQIGTTGEIEAKKLEGVEVKSYDDVGLAIQDLMNDQVDAVIADNPLILGYVGKNTDKIKAVGDVFTDEYYGIAICKDKQDLLDKINKGLAEVKASGLIDELTKKWLESGQ